MEMPQREFVVSHVLCIINFCLGFECIKSSREKKILSMWLPISLGQRALHFSIAIYLIFHNQNNQKYVNFQLVRCVQPAKWDFFLHINPIFLMQRSISRYIDNILYIWFENFDWSMWIVNAKMSKNYFCHLKMAFICVYIWMYIEELGCFSTCWSFSIASSISNILKCSARSKIIFRLKGNDLKNGIPKMDREFVNGMTVNTISYIYFSHLFFLLSDVVLVCVCVWIQMRLNAK